MNFGYEVGQLNLDQPVFEHMITLPPSPPKYRYSLMHSTGYITMRFKCDST